MDINTIKAQLNGILENGTDKEVIRVYTHGMTVKHRIPGAIPPHHNIGIRSEIIGLSRAAARRLRHALMIMSIPDSIVVGATLTVAWRDKNCDPLMDEFKRNLNNYSHKFVDAFSASGFIYRVELQRRGAPHIHCCIYLSKQDMAKVYPNLSSKARLTKCLAKIKMLWISSISLHGGSQAYFNKHGVKFDILDGKNRDNLFNYLADHTSKHKAIQSCYKGKQWGIINKAAFVYEEGKKLRPFINEHHRARFWQYVRKINRYRLSKDWKKMPVFGCVYKCWRYKRSVIFSRGGGELIQRIYDITLKETLEACAELRLAA